MVLGPVVRELRLHLIDDLMPTRSKRADELSWHIGGYAFDLAERLSRLDLSTGLIATVGDTVEDRQMLAEIRERGVQTRAIRRGGPARMTVRLRTPSQSIAIEPSTSHEPPTAAGIVSALKGARHLHVCPECTVRGIVRSRSLLALNNARESGLSTSLSLPDGPDTVRTFDISDRRSLLSAADVVFARGNVLRSLTGERRLGRATEILMEWGVSAVVASLDAGGVRVYGRREAERIPRFGHETPSPSPPFASGFLLGWLLGANVIVCGLMGAAASMVGQRARLPNRRRLTERLGATRTKPALRKLVPELMEAQRALSRAKRLPPRARART